MQDLSSNELLFRVFSAQEKVRTALNASGDDLSELVQVCVVGRENCGKSSLLTMISGVLFPDGGGKDNSGCCTRCPIVVQMRRDDTVADGECCISVNGCSHGTKESAKEAMQKIMDDLSDKNIFTNKPINVTVTGPKLNSLTLVDLPGLIDQESSVSDFEEVKSESSDPSVTIAATSIADTSMTIASGAAAAVTGARDCSLKEQVDKMVNFYIKKENTIIVVVQRAGATSHGERPLELAVAADKNFERTMKVMTRCDELKNASDIERAAKRLAITEDLASGLGWHAVCCRICGLDTTIDDESAELAKFFDGFENIGTPKLQDRLTVLLANKLRAKSDVLKMKVEMKLSQSMDTISELGREPIPASILLNKVRSEIRRFDKAEHNLSKLLRQFKVDLLAMSSKLTRDQVTQGFFLSVFRVPFFQGESCFEESVEWIVDHLWKEPIQTFLKQVYQITAYLPKQAFDHIDSSAASVIQKAWSDKYFKIKEDITKQCLTVEVEKEKLYGTLRERYISDFMIPDAYIQHFINQVVITDVNSGNIAITRRNLTQKLRQTVHSFRGSDSAVEVDSSSSILTASDSFENAQRERIYKAVLAYYPIMVDNLTEQIHRSVNKYVVKPRAEWIRSHITENQAFIDCACESTEVEMRRKHALDNEKAMSEFLKELDLFTD